MKKIKWLITFTYTYLFCVIVAVLSPVALMFGYQTTVNIEKEK